MAWHISMTEKDGYEDRIVAINDLQMTKNPKMIMTLG